MGPSLLAPPTPHTPHPHPTPMPAHFGTTIFDGFVVRVDGKPISIGLGPEKLIKPLETGGLELGLGLGFSGLRPESMTVLSCDGVDALDFSSPLPADSSGARAWAPNEPDEDALERSFFGAVDLDPNSFEKGDGLFSPITKYEAPVIPPLLLLLLFFGRGELFWPGGFF